MEILKVLLVIVLIALTAFFVASEYSVIRVRMSRINQLVAEGNKNAKAVKHIISKLDEFLSACQLGTTLTSMALGWVGESTVERLLHPLFELVHMPASLESVVSFIIAFMILTYFEVVIGELVPKNFAIQIAEPMALFFARPLIIFYKITYPFNWVLSRSSRLITGVFGIKPMSEEDAALSEAELRFALTEGYRSGEITPTEYKYLNNVFDFDDRDAREIMVPRTAIRVVSHDANVRDVMDVIDPKAYNYLPVVTDGDKDKVQGMIHVKDMLHQVVRNTTGGNAPITPFIRPILQVIETVQARDLLAQMQKAGINIAVLMDEYGGTSGLVTLEDIIEEIVGDIPSGSTSGTGNGIPESSLITKLEDNRFAFKAQTPIHDVNKKLKINIPSGDEVYTIGGWMLSEKFDLAQGGSMRYEDCKFTVRKMEGPHIILIEATKDIVVEEINKEEEEKKR
ncbi:hemolysin family protein [Paenibacillus pini]|uniref:Hemolysin and related protein containing CBS domains n=1 Tax=Paenibacillus pini JCM 16418 TaxID=1236976 RepID=W7YVB7_9BACL|nr:hemolysin family protein [Paenibacillus pini]GAF08551.1 hemolysin and related protein containing CBS domains [Paenibacillus pini JCM 16418]